MIGHVQQSMTRQKSNLDKHVRCASTMSLVPPRTPEKRSQPSIVSDTPYSRTSHSVSSGISSAVRHQSSVESYLHDELSGSIQKNCTSFFDRLTDHIKSDLILIDLVNAASTKEHAWPSEKSGEREFYTPCSSMLNHFGDTLRAHLTKNRHPISFRNIYFHRYDRNVQHMQSKVKLKPDLLGLPELVDEELFCVRWEDVIFPGEAKFEDFIALIHQAASYARAVFSHQRNRLWVYCIMLPRPNTMIFARYDRSGLVMSPEYDVLCQDGRKNIAMALFALMTLGDVQFGIDRTISGNDIVIGNVLFRIVETLCYRECVRGRGTRVYVLEPKAPGSPNVISTPNAIKPDTAITSPPVLRRSLRLKKKKEDEKTKVTKVPQTVRCWYFSTLLVPHFSRSQNQKTVQFQLASRPLEVPSVSDIVMEAKSCVLKEAWGIRDLDREGDVIKSFQQYGHRRIFGVPSYGPRFTEMADANTPYSTDIFTAGEKIEVRNLMRQVIWTKGRKLSTAKGPRELFTTILHAIKGAALVCWRWQAHTVRNTGLLNVFRLGFVHRDVSSGNIWIVDATNGRMVMR
jgi:hypothetical protein